MQQDKTQSKENILSQARCFNNIFLYGSLQDGAETGEKNTKIQYNDLKIKNKKITCTPNTAFEKTLISTNKLMLLGNISQLHP